MRFLRHLRHVNLTHRPAYLKGGLIGLMVLQFAGVVLFSLLGGCSRSEFASAELQARLPEKIDFNFHVKPILSDRCFACHGPDANKREADLRLDTEEGAFAALDDMGKRHAIVRGNLRGSEMFQRIVSTDPELMMPPPNSNLSLSDYEIAVLEKWIEQGAEWKEHWSFIAPRKPELPKVQHGKWARNPIDHFVLARLEREGLQPASEAPKEQLLRRVTFDLTGLPPTVEEVDAFLADTSPNAYEQAVDRLLASPHYGERLAVEWLDVARYADSHGYQDDGMRNSWPWREWVIKAYNQNLPYNEFIKWQLAGDLLPQPTKDQLLATSFNRNHPQTQEGGVVDEEYRVEYVADRTNTFGKALLGLTVECARCHDHKYDPISQKDYFSLFAFFNNNNDSGIIPYNGEASPTIILPSPEAEEKLQALRGKMRPLEERLRPEHFRAGFEKWLPLARQNPDKFAKGKVGPLAWFKFEEPQAELEFANAAAGPAKAKLSGDKDRRPQVVPGKSGQGRRFIGDAGISVSEELNFDRFQPFTVSLWVNLEKLGEEGTLFAKCNGEFDGYRGYRCLLNQDGSLSVSLNHVWPDNGIDLRITDKLKPGQWHHLVLTYDGSSKAEGVGVYLDGKPANRTVLTDNLQKSIMHGVNKSNWSKTSFLLGKDVRGSIKDVVMDELVAYNRQLSPLEVRELHGEQVLLRKLFQTPREQLTKEQEEDLFVFYRLNFDPTFTETLTKLTKLREEETLLITDQPEVMIMRERKEALRTFLLDRGEYDAPKEEVQANTPAKLVAFDQKQPKNRLGLSEWLLSPKHPLTSRVSVNRFWAMCFGNGLVSSVDDFGNQGALPTHPELLDWLAVHFMESGWDTKALLKLMVTSATYRQASVPSAEAREKDPGNILFSRAPSYRLSAEMIRDNALAASGLLVPKIGGPSVYPYQPEGIWEALATRNLTTYKQGTGEDLYRRSLYTVWKRSSPPPSMMNFDAPDRYLCVVKRQKTATPLQSLVLLNDPQYVEASRKLAERMMQEGGAKPEQRITYAFKALTSRAPRPKELTLLQQLYAEELADFRKKPERVPELLSVGEAARDTALNAEELATCTIIASTIMNFDEFVMKR
ncbi:DUF1553 domain-containing protein [soil metagenome]